MAKLFVGVGDQFFTDEVKFTKEGGIAIQLINDTGAVSAKGQAVSISSDDHTAVLTPVDENSCIGIMYEDGVAEGALMWVVISGRADAYITGAVTAGNFIRTIVTADSESAGAIIGEAFPALPIVEDFQNEVESDLIFFKIGVALESGEDQFCKVLLK